MTPKRQCACALPHEFPRRELEVLVTGNQMKAARALVGLGQEAMAAAAGVARNTIISMERCRAKPIRAEFNSALAVQAALISAAVQFVANGGGIGAQIKAHPIHG